jgi:pimeloyl-ACP methyl ester carboxylesterase
VEERDFVRVPVDGAELEVVDWGSGEPVVFVQTALTADEFAPVAAQPALAGYRKVVYHRRGYAGSSPVEGTGSVVRDAGDCGMLLDALGVGAAHVVGFSYSGAVAMQLAADAPARVGTLSLLEPPPVHTPSSGQFRSVIDELLRTWHERGPDEALDVILSRVIGPDWRATTEAKLPGSTAQMARDAATFFEIDLPALLRWDFDTAAAARIACPVLHVGGGDTDPWFVEVRSLVLEWLPHAEDVVIPGADHGMPLSHPREVAEAIAGFLERHPIDA